MNPKPCCEGIRLTRSLHSIDCPRIRYEPQLQTVNVEPEPMRAATQDEITEATVDGLREARRSGQWHEGRRYRIAICALIRQWRERDTPDFFVAAQELEDTLLALRASEPPDPGTDDHQ